VLRVFISFRESAAERETSSKTSGGRATWHTDNRGLGVIDESAETAEDGVALLALLEIVHRLARFVCLDDYYGTCGIILTNFVRYGAGKSKPSAAGSLENGLDLGNISGALGDEREDGGRVLLVRRQAKRVRASMRAVVLITIAIRVLL
jgi:hypothetical protein